MMYREDAGGSLAIGQAAHAWICGQLARAWGNPRFAAPRPWEEVCLAAEQHDVGMAAWDSAPTRNPATGRPYSFLEMPLATHLALWRGVKALTLPQSRFASLLISAHGTGLYERRDLSADPPGVREPVQAFLTEERAFQARLIEGLRADPHYAAFVTDEAIARHRALIRAWDSLSLALCMAAPTRTVADVPAADSTLTLNLTAVDDTCRGYCLSPWPFHAESLSLTVEGRRLPGTYADDEAIRSALAQAPWVTLTFQLSAS